MNRTFSFIALCFAVFVLGSYNCAAAASVKLSGRILNRESDSIKISFNESRLAYFPQVFYAVLDKKGNFNLTFPVPAGSYTQVEFNHGRHLADMMLTADDSIFVSIDVSNFDRTITYSGRGSQVCNFVAQHTLSRGRLNGYSMKLRSHIEKEPDAFLKAIQAEQEQESNYLNKNKIGLPVPFIRYWTAFHTYYNYFFMQQYPTVHEMVKLHRYTDTIPAENYTALSAMKDEFNDDLLQVPSYLLYLTGIFEVRLKQSGYAFPLSEPENAARFLDSINTLAYKVLPDKSGQYFVAQSLYARIKRQDIDRTHREFSAFDKRWPESEYRELLAAQIKVTERLAPGQPAPDFELATTDGKHIKLSDLKGKAVYIGFWATWCKQCVGEMRLAEQKVKSVLANKPVEFVYVSLDEDTAAAKVLLQHLKLENNFAWTTGGWYAPIVAQYGVQSLPAYFLVNPEGNFAVQTPPSPPQTIDLIVAISKLY
jgi:thiol-disulfide isomerase/thioredoxin